MALRKRASCIRLAIFRPPMYKFTQYWLFDINYVNARRGYWYWLMFARFAWAAWCYWAAGARYEQMPLRCFQPPLYSMLKISAISTSLYAPEFRRWAATRHMPPEDADLPAATAPLKWSTRWLYMIPDSPLWAGRPMTPISNFSSSGLWFASSRNSTLLEKQYGEAPARCCASRNFFVISRHFAQHRLRQLFATCPRHSRLKSPWIFCLTWGYLQFHSLCAPWVFLSSTYHCSLRWATPSLIPDTPTYA